MWDTVKITPYSSVVGQSLMLLDKSGRCIAQISLMDPGMAGTDVKALAAEIAARLAKADAILALKSSQPIALAGEALNAEELHFLRHKVSAEYLTYTLETVTGGLKPHETRHMEWLGALSEKLENSAALSTPKQATPAVEALREGEADV